MIITETGNVGIGTTSPAAILELRSDGSAAGGAEIRLQHDNNNTTDVVSTVNFANNVGSVAMIQAGTTGANNTGYIAMFTDNAGVSSEKIRILGNGNIGIGTTSPAAKLTLSTPNAYDGTILQLQSRDEPTAYNLKINEVVTAGVVRWSFDMTNSSAYNNVLVLDRGNVGIGTTTPSEVLTVEGNISSSGDLYLSQALLATAEVTTTASGNYTVYSVATSSHDGAFYDYTLRSGSNARAGNIMAIWSGTDVNYTEITTTDFGDTTGVSLDVSIVGGNMVLTGSFDAADWTIKTIIRSI